jgi:hypothetical protein
VYSHLDMKISFTMVVLDLVLMFQFLKCVPLLLIKITMLILLVGVILTVIFNVCNIIYLHVRHLLAK